jgi:hypothetical protein
MMTKIPVASRKEAEQIRRGLQDPEVRAFVKIAGTLLALQSDRARKRVMEFVIDSLDEEHTSAQR